MTRILKMKDLKQLCGLSTPSIYRLIQQGRFPKQIKLSERSSGWLLSEVEKWIDDKANARDGGDQ